MTAPRRKRAPARRTASVGTLASLGIEPTEERIYRALLAKKGVRAATLADQLKLGKPLARAALHALEHKGLVSRSAESEPRYFAVPPDIAIEALIAQRQTELYRARAAVVELRDVLHSSDGKRREDPSDVEILSHEAISKVFPQIMVAARTEIICFERMPMLVWDATPNDAELQCLARGVGIRIIADSAMLNVRRHVERLRAAVEAGESYRVYSGLPMKMVIVDRSVGIIPIHTDKPGGSHLLLRSSSLLQAMCETFEVFWRLAAPFDLQGDAKVEAGPRGTDSLVRLLATGLNDKTIEQELGISRRTLARRIVELMKQYGASTRFQFGWLAAKDAPSRLRKR